MYEHDSAGRPGRAASAAGDVQQEPLTRRQKFLLVVKVVELRLRFIALMAATGLTFAYWDTIWNRYDKWTRPAGGVRAASSGYEFYCPMHPQVVQDEHGACPICGMPLARRVKGARQQLPAGITARVTLAPFRVAQAGIKTVSVSYEPLARTLTTVGLVAVDERRLANIVSKVPGKTRIEKLYVNYTGQEVEAGRPLADLYSPELSQAVQELLTAARRAGPSAEPRTESARILREDRQEMVRASAEKLKLWGITQTQIDEVLKTGKADVTVPILAPIGGRVLKKNVVEGQEVREGFPLFEVADLRSVWIKAQVYEHQLGLIREGDRVAATVEAYPGETFAGKVEFIQPILDPATRTVDVRFALDNPGLRLRPGMFATVTLKAPLADLPEFKARAMAKHPSGDGKPTAEQQEKCPVTNLKLGAMGDPVTVDVEGRTVWTCCAACPPKLKAQPARYLARLAPPPANQVLSVPEPSVIDTGTRKIVYIETEPGVFEGREVVLGPRTGDRFPVLDGLAVGENVAAAGAFLIDAESRINPGAEPARPSEPETPKAREHPPRSAAVSTDAVSR
jgi:Cu(I)/Ag(I) efflux system membrane fusion protein